MCNAIDRSIGASVSQYLYRGVNAGSFEKSGPALGPRGSGPYRAPAIWDQFHWGGAHWGVTEGNAVLRHLWQQLGLPTAGISVTPVFERAKYYALGGGLFACGYIYVIDRPYLRTLACVSTASRTSSATRQFITCNCGGRRGRAIQGAPNFDKCRAASPPCNHWPSRLFSQLMSLMRQRWIPPFG